MRRVTAGVEAHQQLVRLGYSRLLDVAAFESVSEASVLLGPWQLHQQVWQQQQQLSLPLLGQTFRHLRTRAGSWATKAGQDKDDGSSSPHSRANRQHQGQLLQQQASSSRYQGQWHDSDMQQQQGQGHSKTWQQRQSRRQQSEDNDDFYDQPPPGYQKRPAAWQQQQQQQHRKQQQPNSRGQVQPAERQQQVPPNIAAQQLALKHRQRWQQQQQQKRQEGSSERDKGRRAWQQESSSPRSGNRTRSSSSSSRHAAAVFAGSEVWQQVQSGTGSSRSSSGSGKPHSGRLLSPAALTQAINAADSLHALQQLLMKHKEALQQINVCAAYKAVVRLSAGTLGPAGGSSSSSSSSAGADGAAGLQQQQQQQGGVALSIMRQLSSRMLQQIKVARPWDLAQAAWACSKLQYLDSRLLDGIAQQAVRKAAILLPQDIAQLASAYARLGYRQPQLMQLLQQQAVAKAATFEPWSFIHTAWALQVSGVDCTPLLELAAQQLAGKLGSLKALDVATLLWLMASQGFHNQQLLEAAAQQLTAGMDSYPPAALVQALISCAGLGFTDPDLAAAGAREVLGQLQLQQLSPKQVAHASFACVRLGSASSQLLDAAAAAFLANPGAYSPSLLCMLCWSFLQAGHVHNEFEEKLVEQCQLQLQLFSAGQVASILRGMYRMTGRSDSPAITQLLAAAYTQLPQQLPTMSSAILSKLITTLAKQYSTARARFTVTDTDVFASAASAASSSSTSHQQEEQQRQQQEEQQVLVLLRHCGEEWLQAGRQGQLDVRQAAAVQSALQGAGLEELAAAAGEVHARLTTGAAAIVASQQQQPDGQQQQQLYAGEVPGAFSSSKASSGGQRRDEPAGGSWVDSFVATTADDDK